MGRLYVAPATGDGTQESPYVAEVCTFPHVRRCRSVIAPAADGQRGRPLYSWSLAYVEVHTNQATGEPDWSGFDDSADWPMQVTETLTDIVLQPVKVRVRQAGVLTQAELDLVTDYYSLIDTMLKKHYGPNATVEAQFPELFQ